MVQADIIHLFNRSTVMESGCKIVSANVSTEPSCELAASSSQNSLPGGSSLVCLRKESVNSVLTSYSHRSNQQTVCLLLIHIDPISKQCAYFLFT